MQTNSTVAATARRCPCYARGSPRWEAAHARLLSPAHARATACLPRLARRLGARCARLLHLRLLPQGDQQRVPYRCQGGERGYLSHPRLPAAGSTRLRVARGEVRPPTDPDAERRELLRRAA